MFGFVPNLMRDAVVGQVLDDMLDALVFTFYLTKRASSKADITLPNDDSGFDKRWQRDLVGVPSWVSSSTDNLSWRSPTWCLFQNSIRVAGVGLVLAV